MEESMLLSGAKDFNNNDLEDMKMLEGLPRDRRWGYSEDLYQYQGFWTYLPFLKGLILAQTNFKPQPNDILICSHPKTGTTWLKALAFAIAARNLDEDSLLTKVPHDLIPFLEIDLVSCNPSRIKRNPKIPIISTHSPYSLLPDSITSSSSSCKIVYVWRDPKDVFISMWLFYAKLTGKDPLPIEEALDLFCNGVSWYGPYWDHVLGFLRAESEEKVLILKYEEMKEDSCYYVKRLAEFMGYPFSQEEEEKGSVEKIVKFCSFENLSNLEVNKSGKHRDNTEMAVENQIYFRKGEVGDWVNHLTPEMAKRIDDLTRKMFHGGLNTNA